MFGVSRRSETILASFDALCGESLQLDVGRRRPEFSRINADGTPFQFSLTLNGACTAPLQFLSEAGVPGCGIAERLSSSYRCLNELATICDLVDDVERLLPALRDLIPERDPHLVADHSGMFWFGLSFRDDPSPSLTVYINGRWGPKTAQWHRVDRFAALFSSAGHWHSLATLADPALTPLGMAITLRAGTPPTGRIYLQAFGVRLNAYRTLFLQSVPSSGLHAEQFDLFGRRVLGEDVIYPLRSAVFSFELPDTPASGAKFEVCAHCAFANDIEAGSRITGWLHEFGVDAHRYDQMVATLTHGGSLSSLALPSLHAYVGLGARPSSGYASIYLNPGPALDCA